jgi:hypothetical protein
MDPRPAIGITVPFNFEMKSTIFWDITPFSVERQRTVRRNISPSPSGLTNKQSKKSAQKLALLGTCFHSGFLVGLFFKPEDGGDVPPKLRLTFNGLHGDIFQNLVFFITTTARTSNPTHLNFLI